MRLLCIFLWKQAILSYARPQQATLLERAPHIIWNLDDDQDVVPRSGRRQRSAFVYTAPRMHDSDDDDNDKVAVVSHPNITRAGVYKVVSEQSRDSIAMPLLTLVGGIEQVVHNYMYASHSAAIEPSADYVLLMNMLHLLNHNAQDSRIKKVHCREHEEHMYYYFDQHNTLLHHACGAALTRKASKLFYHCISQVVLVVSIVLYAVALLTYGSLDKDPGSVFSALSIAISVLVFIPYCVFVFLSINVSAFKLVISTTFDFWLKTVHALVYVACIWMEDAVFVSADVLVWLEDVAFSVWFILLITSVASMDAINVDSRWKILVLTCIVFVSALWIGYLMFFSLTDAQLMDERLIRLHAGYSISFLSLKVSAFRVLAIFCCKQWILTIRNSRKEHTVSRAVLIRYVPRIRWITEEERNQEVPGAHNKLYSLNKPTVQDEERSGHRQKSGMSAKDSALSDIGSVQDLSGHFSFSVSEIGAQSTGFLE